MAATNCQIITEIERPPRKTIEAFRGIPAANIDDCLNRMAAMDCRIRPYSQPQLLGSAFTIKVPYGDNLMLHKAADLAHPGDILVISCEESLNRAILGSMLVHYLKVRGIGGLVVDGAIRDSDEIAQIKDFPVYARCTSPNGPFKEGPGEINTPVSVGGVIVKPGDILCGDSDGIVVVPRDSASIVLAEAHAIMTKEEEMMKKILENDFARPWVDEKLKALGCSFL